MLSALPLSLLLLISTYGYAAPQSNAPGFTMNLRRSMHVPSTDEEIVAWAKKHKANMAAKYGSSSGSKRSAGTNLLVNQGLDSSYYGSIAVGTPAVSYNVILDTGSSDLWLAGNGCTNCDLLPTFQPSSSSTFQNLNQDFEITYGLGFAQGTIGQDHVQMAGFSVTNQQFAVCDTIAEDLITQPVSGLMGLAFQTIATSRAPPFWQSLAQGNAWDSPVMAFQLTRYSDDKNPQELEVGGTFTMGAVNTSLYTGDIDFQPMPDTPTYWLQSVTGVTVNGKSITLPSGGQAAIDTGTTLVGGPTDQIAAIYAQIPGSQALTGQGMDGYYVYPCNTQVTVTMSFGGKSWPMNPVDFIAQTYSHSSQCLGAFFVNPATGTSAPDWIVGDAFLKNVYSVFQFNPPAVGFATLSQTALGMNDADLPVPEPTIGAIIASTTASTGGSREHSGGVKSLISGSSTVYTTLILLTSMVWTVVC